MSTQRNNNADVTSIGMWSPEVAANVVSLLSINREPIEYTKDQLIQLYLMIYPFIAADFTHRDDFFSWATKQMSEQSEEIKKLNASLKLLKDELDNHIHIGNYGSPTTVPTVPITKIETKIWKTLPEDEDFKFGEKLIVNTSSYSSSIVHRSPDVDSTNIKRTKSSDIASSYKKQLRMIPFDIGGDGISEESKFANSGNP